MVDTNDNIVSEEERDRLIRDYEQQSRDGVFSNPDITRLIGQHLHDRDDLTYARIAFPQYTPAVSAAIHQRLRRKPVQVEGFGQAECTRDMHGRLHSFDNKPSCQRNGLQLHHKSGKLHKTGYEFDKGAAVYFTTPGDTKRHHTTYVYYYEGVRLATLTESPDRARTLRIDGGQGRAVGVLTPAVVRKIRNIKVTDNDIIVTLHKDDVINPWLNVDHITLPYAGDGSVETVLSDSLWKRLEQVQYDRHAHETVRQCLYRFATNEQANSSPLFTIITPKTDFLEFTMNPGLSGMRVALSPFLQPRRRRPWGSRPDRTQFTWGDLANDATFSYQIRADAIVMEILDDEHAQHSYNDNFCYFTMGLTSRGNSIYWNDTETHDNIHLDDIEMEWKRHGVLHRTGPNKPASIAYGTEDSNMHETYAHSLLPDDHQVFQIDRHGTVVVVPEYHPARNMILNQPRWNFDIETLAADGSVRITRAART